MSLNFFENTNQINDLIIEKPFKLKDKSKRCLLYLKKDKKISLPFIKTPRLKLYFSLSKSKWNNVKIIITSIY